VRAGGRAGVDGWMVHRILREWKHGAETTLTYYRRSGATNGFPTLT
jgi:hypothetical protein